VRRLGADVVVDHRTEDFEEVLSDYDLVLDSLGGENLERSLRVLKKGGLAIGISGPPDPAFAERKQLNAVVRLAIAALSRKVRRQAKRLGVRYEFLFMRADGAQLSSIATLVDDGVITPVVSKTYPFEQIPAALADLAAGGGRGKIVATLES
jgi:NADPH:quinone reductase-like Zn-dependent oxidoreductase